MVLRGDAKSWFYSPLGSNLWTDSQIERERKREREVMVVFVLISTPVFRWSDFHVSGKVKTGRQMGHGRGIWVHSLKSDRKAFQKVTNL